MRQRKLLPQLSEVPATSSLKKSLSQMDTPIEQRLHLGFSTSWGRVFIPDHKKVRSLRQYYFLQSNNQAKRGGEVWTWNKGHDHAHE